MERQNVLYTPHMLVVEDDTVTSTWHLKKNQFGVIEQLFT